MGSWLSVLYASGITRHCVTWFWLTPSDTLLTYIYRGRASPLCRGYKTYTRMHIQTHTHIHTHTNTYTHTCIHDMNMCMLIYVHTRHLGKKKYSLDIYEKSLRYCDITIAPFRIFPLVPYTTTWIQWLRYLFLVEGDPKASFSIATTPRYRGRRYSIPRIAPLYLIVLKAASRTIFLIFGMNRPRIESRSPRPLANTLHIRPMGQNGRLTYNWT